MMLVKGMHYGQRGQLVLRWPERGHLCQIGLWHHLSFRDNAILHLSHSDLITVHTFTFNK